MEEGLQKENFLVVQVVSALLGLIAPDLRTVAFRCEDDLLTLYFSYQELGEAVEDDVEDISSELDVNLEGKYEIRTVMTTTSVGTRTEDGMRLRVVFQRK